MKRGFLFVCVILICQVVNAQVHFGIKGGMNFANAVKVHGGPTLRLAGYFGGKMSVPLGGNFSFAPELLFTGKGYIYHEFSDDGNGFPVRLNYIAAPILFDYLFDSKTHLVVGAEIEYLLSAKKIHSIKEDVKYLFTPDFDLGLCAGIEHQFSKNLHVEFRYVHGVTKIYHAYNLPNREPYDMSGYNRVFQIGLVYDFN